MSFKKKFAILGLTAALSAGALAPAMAASMKVGGGVLEYGTNGSVAYSNYFHARMNHYSTVQANGANYSSGCTVANAWSFKSVTQIPGVSYQYFYNFC